MGLCPAKSDVTGSLDCKLLARIFGSRTLGSQNLRLEVPLVLCRDSESLIVSDQAAFSTVALLSDLSVRHLLVDLSQMLSWADIRVVEAYLFAALIAIRRHAVVHVIDFKLAAFLRRCRQTAV